MNRKNLIVAAFFVGLMVCILALLAGRLDANTEWGYYLGWIGGAVFCVVMMFLTYFRRDKVPDILGRLGLSVFERNGFCFSVQTRVRFGRAQWIVAFQNRYTSPCSVDLLFRPGREEGEASFASACQCLALPALEALDAQPTKLQELFGAWSRVREEFLAEDATCRVSDFVIFEQPRSGGDEVDVFIGLRGPRFGRLVFRNVAVQGDGRWYLTVAEPVRVPSAAPGDGARSAPVFR